MELPSGYTDPFTILFNGLAETFRQNPLIGDMVRPDNFVIFDGVLGLKDSVQHGDLPELVIVPNGHSQEDMGTSASGRISESYKVFFSTDDKRAVYIHALQWEIYRCLETFNAYVAGNLLYNGQRFIEILKFGSGSESVTSPDFNRGINGWCASWEFTIGMRFPHSDLLFEVKLDSDEEQGEIQCDDTVEAEE